MISNWTLVPTATQSGVPSAPPADVPLTADGIDKSSLAQAMLWASTLGQAQAAD